MLNINSFHGIFWEYSSFYFFRAVGGVRKRQSGSSNTAADCNFSKGIIQYNKDNRNGATSNITIDTLCDIMISAKGSPVEKLAEVNNFLLDATNEECLDYSYDKMIEEMSEINWDSEAGVGGRQWTYQTCTGKEF